MDKVIILGWMSVWLISTGATLGDEVVGSINVLSDLPAVAVHAATDFVTAADSVIIITDERPGITPNVNLPNESAEDWSEPFSPLSLN